MENLFLYVSTLPSFSYRTNTRIKSFNITEKNILSIIKPLDATKAHVCGNLSAKMIQICKEVMTIPLKLIFDQSLRKRKFPEISKAANVVPVHKKEVSSEKSLSYQLTSYFC